MDDPNKRTRSSSFDDDVQEQGHVKKERGAFEALVDALETAEKHRPTQEQQDIYRFVCQGQGNALIDAVAGSGKTSTILQCLWFIPPTSRVLIVSFNKHVQSTFQQRLALMQYYMNCALCDDPYTQSAPFPKVCDVRTCHSFGWCVLRRHFGAEFEESKRKKVDLFQKVIDDVWSHDKRVHKDLKKWKHNGAALLSLLMQLAVDCTPETKWSSQFVEDAAEKYNIRLPDKYRLRTAFMQLLRDVFEQNTQSQSAFDFVDMVFLPVYLNIPFPQYDFIFVDECQDINAIQMEMMSRALAPNTGRVIFVGDQNQSIYGFRGADPQAVRTISDRFQTQSFPLWTCWRCPVRVIQMAKSIVPRIKARAGAPEGLAETIEMDEMHALIDELAKDTTQSVSVLCRTNAPLAELCMSLIDRGIMAVIRAPAVMSAVLGLLRAVDRSAWLGGANVPLLKRVQKYHSWLERSATEDGQSRIENLDKIETLERIVQSMSPQRSLTIDQVDTQVRRIFGPHGGSIVLSTIHQIKGQERDIIFIYRTDLLPHPYAQEGWQQEQERHLEYVAITRSKSKLYHVLPERDDDWR